MRYLLKQFITLIKMQLTTRLFHRLYGLLPERGGIIGNYRIEGRDYGAHFPDDEQEYHSRGKRR